MHNNIWGSCRPIILSFICIVALCFNSFCQKLTTDSLVQKPKVYIGVHTDIFLQALDDPRIRCGLVLDADRDALIADVEYGVNTQRRMNYQWLGFGVEYERFIFSRGYIGVRYEHDYRRETLTNATFYTPNFRWHADKTTRQIERNSLMGKFGCRLRRARFYFDANIGIGLGRRVIRFVDNINTRATAGDFDDCFELFCIDDKHIAGRRRVAVGHAGIRIGYYLNEKRSSMVKLDL